MVEVDNTFENNSSPFIVPCLSTEQVRTNE